MRISDWSSDVCSSDRLRLVHDAVVGAAHPVIEPAQTFLQIADGRSRHAGVGKAVAPGTHQGLPWNIDCLNRLEHGADIGSVGPAADGRSEEHTSELQSLMRISYAVSCLKKKNNTNRTRYDNENT